VEAKRGNATIESKHSVQSSLWTAWLGPGGCKSNKSKSPLVDKTNKINSSLGILPGEWTWAHDILRTSNQVGAVKFS
jgi:hypothetical protein